MSTLNELKRLLGDWTPLRRPRCQHISFDRRACDRPAEHECDPGPDGRRPRFVCSGCLRYQVAAVGRLVAAEDVKVVRFTAEGVIARGRRRRRR